MDEALSVLRFLASDFAATGAEHGIGTHNQIWTSVAMSRRLTRAHTNLDHEGTNQAGSCWHYPETNIASMASWLTYRRKGSGVCTPKSVTPPTQVAPFLSNQYESAAFMKITRVSLWLPAISPRHLGGILTSRVTVVELRCTASDSEITSSRASATKTRPITRSCFLRGHL